MKKLLFVISGSKFFLSHRLALAQAAARAGYEVHIATPSSSLDQRVRDTGLIHHPIQLDRGSKNLLKEMTAIFSLWRLYRRIQPDLIHHITVKPVLYGGIAARMAGISAIANTFTGLGFMFTDQSWLTKLLRRLMHWGYKRSFRHKNMQVIFQNQDDKAYFMNAKLLSPEQCTIIRGSGVCMSSFFPTEEKAADILVILAARMLWDKGIKEFVEAARILKNKKIPARFALIGGGDGANPSSIPEIQLQQWVKEGWVEWWGERNDMPAIMQSAHVVCLPSYREGLPKVLIEAAASGRAVVATDVPGCRDIVRHQENGLLVPAKNSEALAAALEKLILHPDLRKNMGQKARSLVEQDYALETVIQKTLAVYNKLC